MSHKNCNKTNMQRKTARKIQFTTDEQIRDALFEFFIFICFLILTTIVVLSVRDPYMFYMNKVIDKLFVNRDITVGPGITINYLQLITVNDLWDYMNYGFLSVFHGGILPENKTKASDANKIPEKYQKYISPINDLSNETGIRPEDITKNDKENLKEKTNINGFFSSDKDTEFEWLKTAETRKGSGSISSPGGFDWNATTALNLIGRIFIMDNVLLGPPILRQIRVKKDSCYVNDAFIRYFNTCYAEYSTSQEDTSAEYKGTEFQTLSELQATSIWAKIGSYKGAGFIQKLSYNRLENVAIIHNLQNQHWIDRGSRLFVIEWTMYNENLDIFQSNKLIAELPPTGGVLTSAQIYSIREYSFFTEPSLFLTLVVVAFYIMVVYYTIKEIIEIRKIGFRRYIKSISNTIDVVILFFSYIALIYNAWHSVHINSITDHIEEGDEYHSLDNLVYFNRIYVDIMGLLCFLVWIKVFKFISFNKTLVQFTTTLRRCAKDLAGFSLMFLIVFLAYAQLGLLLFGTKHPDFRNFLTSVLTMIRMILGDFQYDLIEEANRILGPFYFLTYILLVFFILLNMFLAIIMETYSSVKAEITEGRSQLGSYLVKKIMQAYYYIRFCGRAPPEILSRIEAPVTSSLNIQVNKSHSVAEETSVPKKYFDESTPVTHTKELNRLANRVALLEDMLEQLVTNMDKILKKVEYKKSRD